MPHSLRLYKKSGLSDRMLWFVAACICALMPATSIASTQEVHPRILLTPAQIVSAMQEHQLPIRGVTVRLAAPITAGIANPELEIQSIALLNTHEARLRMTCRDHSQCLSFFAIATYPEEVNPASLMIKPERQPASAEHLLSPIKPVAEAPIVSTFLKPSTSGGSPILKSGSSATLNFDSERVHVRVQVVCLENGVAGDKIRVTTRDRKQTYVAEIVNPTLLKGTF